MDNRIIIGAVIVILVIIGAIVLLTGALNNPVNPNPVQAASTKLAIHNNGSTWVQVEMVMNNVTNKNGTVKTYYVQSFIKPGGNVTIDLSQLLGYTNEKLPAGTTIRIQSWKGLFNQTPGGTDNLNISFQGWSNTLYPGATDEIVPVTYSPLPVAQLPASITDSIFWSSDNLAALQKVIPLDTADQEIVYEEEVITVDANGKVTITITRPPELCRAIASII
ncbi:MAG: hypothetical protein BME94_00300 [Methanobacteriales archaeon Met13]